MENKTAWKTLFESALQNRDWHSLDSLINLGIKEMSDWSTLYMYNLFLKYRIVKIEGNPYLIDADFEIEVGVEINEYFMLELKKDISIVSKFFLDDYELFLFINSLYSLFFKEDYVNYLKSETYFCINNKYYFEAINFLLILINFEHYRYKEDNSLNEIELQYQLGICYESINQFSQAHLCWQKCLRVWENYHQITVGCSIDLGGKPQDDPELYPVYVKLSKYNLWQSTVHKLSS